MYEVKVTVGKSSLQMKWSNNKLTGDEHLIRMVNDTLETRDVIERRPGGPVWTGSEMRSGNAIYFLLLSMFDNVEIVDGELPSLPSIPEGAQG